MSFTSFGFALLFTCVLLARLTIGRTKQRPLYLAILLIASFGFYAWQIPAYSFLLLTSIVVDYGVGLALGFPGQSAQRRRT